MNLFEFYDYKNKLMEDILTSEPIVKLLGDDIDMRDAESLAYTQIFPYEYVPETIQDGKTYICFDVDIQSAENNFTYYPIIYVWVLTHKSRLRLPGGGVRPDMICAEIAKKINGSMEYGMGRLMLYSARRFAPMMDYQGKVLTFKTTDINKAFDPHKAIPANRKKG